MLDSSNVSVDIEAGSVCMFKGIGGSRIVYNTVLRLKLCKSDLNLQGHDLCPFFRILDRNWGKAVLGFPVYTSQAGGQFDLGSVQHCFDLLSLIAILLCMLLNSSVGLVFWVTDPFSNKNICCN
ncbi:hypothetical protein POTOM_025576 [Populus tomentosa]|uniref:Uncharacterized protein n=1 Tax=Populus tomentosa TaxID=118781 RepID=A0A8X8CYL0_POPTO|nr:hypothetical protein POTOM_025576 [Populus tomentosa]